MKNLNILSIAVILLFTLSLFTSCDNDVFDEIVPIDQTVTNPDTILISEEVVFRIGAGEENTFNGISVFCPNPDISLDNHINVIAYGKDLVVSPDGQSAEYSEDLFIFFWETDDEIVPGTYQALVTIQTDVGADAETIAEVTIEEVTENFTRGSFTGRYLNDALDELINFSGSFNVSRYDCELFGDDLPTPDDFDPELSLGYTDLDFGMGEQERLSSMYFLCDEIFPDLEGDKHFQFLANAIIVEGQDLEELFEIRFFVYHRELENLELNREYDAQFGSIGMDEDELGTLEMGEENLISISEPISIVYTEINESYITGVYSGQYNGNNVVGNFMSQVFECN